MAEDKLTLEIATPERLVQRAERLSLHHYDFIEGEPRLTSRAMYKLTKLAERADGEFVTIQGSGSVELDRARREAESEPAAQQANVSSRAMTRSSS